ncbi:MAG TPA: CopG family transcriptional regulator [Nitrosospira sp.]
MPTSIRLPDEIEQWLDFPFTRTGHSKAYYLCEIIERSLDEMEDYYLAADVLECLREGREQAHSAAEVRKDVGLECDAMEAYR